VVHPSLSDVPPCLSIPSLDSGCRVIFRITVGDIIHVACDGLLDSQLEEVDPFGGTEVDVIHGWVVRDPWDEEGSRFTGKGGGDSS